MPYCRIFLVIFTFTIASCSNSIQTDRAYQEIGRSQHFVLKKPGYVIGFEKRPIKENKSEYLPGIETNAGYTERFTLLDRTNDLSNQRNKIFSSVTTGQKKVMLVTQITKNFSGQEYFYNAYENTLSGEYHYETSFSKIDDMFDDLKDELQNVETPYTHVLVMSMGWNNDQVVSLFRYNKILQNLAIAAEQGGDSFKPLVIAFTWPSAWSTISDSWLRTKIGHLISYPNKANDADEIGYTWANWILNHKLPSAIQAANLKITPKTVVIAHSFGARLLSRALFSSNHIDPKYSRHTSVDLFLGLQGAVSGRRFISGAGKEGHPYSDFMKLQTKIVLTTSTNDDANPVAHWVTGASHVGGKHGLSLARKCPDVFDTKVWTGITSEIKLPVDKVLMLDASDIVVGVKKPELSAHNDILDKDMGELMWHFMKILP